VADRLAIKRLTASDCTLFEAVFRKIKAGNQKSINLNADVLTGQLYPNLATAAAATGNEVPVVLTLYGPGGKSGHKLSRKIIKNPSYKNWRLNGEFIMGPQGDPGRYDEIRPGDLALMAFKGETVPNGMELILVSEANPADAAVHAALTSLLGARSMSVATPEQVAAAATRAAAPETHPVYLAAADPALDAALEDAAQCGIRGIRTLLKNRGRRKVSASDLAKAKAKADLTGQEGEGLVDAYLARKVAAGELARVRWISAENAISPFDFETITPVKARTLIDVKATRGPFDNVVHLSLAEIIEASGEVPYRIYRVFELDEIGGKLRISKNIGPLARELKALHETHMPTGIRVDGFSVATSALQWGPEQYLEWPDDEEA
jgi:hypothetical protein